MSKNMIDPFEFAYDYALNKQKLNILKPVTYTDKIGWLKVFDASELKTKCADKIAVHEFCKKTLGKDIAVPIIKIWKSADEINFDELPQKFVIKCNHGSGYNCIVKDKSTADIEDIKHKVKKWLKENYMMRGGEIHYCNIKPHVYVEQFLEFTHEYQFLCFNGTPLFCQVISNRFDKARVANNFHTMDFKFVDICNLYFPNNVNVIDEKPKTFESMQNYAQKLSKEFIFVRVDFYSIDDVVYLSEMTFTPGNGRIKFRNETHNKMLGDMIRLPKLN